MIKDLLKEKCDELGIKITELQLDQFKRYFDMLIEWNSKINLTAILNPEEVAVKHFIDSILVLKYVNIEEGSKIIDVGTGAGFPGIPLKIMRNDVDLTLLDSLNKRINFLESLTSVLGVDATIIHGRAEELGRSNEFREKFTFATARAVAELSILAEYCLPFVEIGGSFIAMKGPAIDDEIINSNNSLKVLGGEFKENWSYCLPDASKRSLCQIEKVMQTPICFPRSQAKIIRRPL